MEERENQLKSFHNFTRELQKFCIENKSFILESDERRRKIENIIQLFDAQSLDDFLSFELKDSD